MKELRQHAEQNKLSIAQVILANEMSITGRSQAEVYAFVDKITNAMVAIVKSGLKASEDDVLPGPIKLHSKASTVYKRAMTESYQSDRGIGVLSAYALAGSEENGRGHLVVTAPTGGSAGVLPAIVYGLGEGGRKLPADKIRQGMLAAAAIGYLCKHNATLSAAEGGCQAEIGVASAMAAALAATAHDASPRVVENAAESLHAEADAPEQGRDEQCDNGRDQNHCDNGVSFFHIESSFARSFPGTVVNVFRGM
jgi:L-serine dehydratase